MLRQAETTAVKLVCQKFKAYLGELLSRELGYKEALANEVCRPGSNLKDLNAVLVIRYGGHSSRL